MRKNYTQEMMVYPGDVEENEKESYDCDVE